jgi:hypothetical protein
MKPKNLFLTLSTFVLAALITGCYDYHYHPTTEDRDVTMFRSVTLDGVGNVYIRLVPTTTTPGTDPTRIDDLYKVTVTADIDVIDKITTTVRDSILYIDGPKGKHKWHWGGIDIDVYMPEYMLDAITLNGVGDIAIFKGNTHNLNIALYGVGDIRVIDGSAHSLNIILDGVGDINTKYYMVNDVTATLSGVGDIRLWATDHLTATLTGVGDIRYIGNPVLITHNSGVGNIYRL